MPEKQYTEKHLAELLGRNPNIVVYDEGALAESGSPFHVQEFDPNDTDHQDPFLTIGVSEKQSFGHIATVLQCKFKGVDRDIVTRISIRNGELVISGDGIENPNHVITVARQALEILDIYKRIQLDPKQYENQVVSRRDVDDVYEIGMEVDPIERMLENLDKALEIG